MQDNQQQAYDRGTTLFSPDGRLYQVEYAREAVERGSASVGVRTDDGVVLAADRQVHSPLLETDSIEKLHTVDDHIAVATAGHVADARKLVDFARRQAQVNQLRYDEPIGVETLAKAVTDHIQEYTQTGGARPFGVALAIGGVDPDGQPRLFETDPSGTPYEWAATAVGGDQARLQEHLEEHYRPDADLDGGIELALSTLASETDELTAESVEVTTVDTETSRVERLDAEALEPYVAEVTDDE